MQWKDRLSLNSLSYVVVSDFGLYLQYLNQGKYLNQMGDDSGLILKQNLLEVRETGEERSRRKNYF